MFKNLFFFSIFLLLPFISKNQPLPGLSCYDQLYLSTISSVGTYCDVNLDLGLGYNQQNCEWSTVFQALNFGGCGAALRIPFQSVNVYPTTIQCSGGSQVVRLAGSVYYQWRVVQVIGEVELTLGSGTFVRPMSDKTVLC